MTTLLAYHGDKKIKAKYLSRVRAHAKADEIVKGQYWEGGKGCAVGCTIHSGKHSAYETELGIPAEIAHLEDCIFEGLKNGAAKAWPERFLKAIKPGANLSLVWPRFAVRLLSDEKYGMTVLAKDAPDSLAAIKGVCALYEREISGNRPSVAEWGAAAREARAARAAGAAGAAGEAGAAWAAREAWAAGAAREAWAARAAGAAREAWAARAARAAGEAAHWTRCADWLVELLESA